MIPICSRQQELSQKACHARPCRLQSNMDAGQIAINERKAWAEAYIVQVQSLRWAAVAIIQVAKMEAHYKLAKRTAYAAAAFALKKLFDKAAGTERLPLMAQFQAQCVFYGDYGCEESSDEELN